MLLPPGRFDENVEGCPIWTPQQREHAVLFRPRLILALWFACRPRLLLRGLLFGANFVRGLRSSRSRNLLDARRIDSGLTLECGRRQLGVRELHGNTPKVIPAFIAGTPASPRSAD